MHETLRELILDFHDNELQTGTTRRLAYERLAGKAFVCIGVRRAGKSTLLFQIVEQLEKQGVDRENIIFFDFFDDRLHPLRQEGLQQILDAYYSLFPDKVGTEKLYIFFDEIQMIDGWESFVSRLLRNKHFEVFISGSSARMLSSEIGTTMRGRSLSWELFPFSFKEYLDHRELDFGRLSSKQRVKVSAAYDDYWRSGGFPEVLTASDGLRRRVHQEYFKTIVHRDIVQRYDVRHPKAVLDLAYRIIDTIGSPYSINRLTNFLKSIGHHTPKTFVASCVDWFEDAFFLFNVETYSPSRAKRRTNPKKAYCVDHALITSIAPNILVNRGHLLENLVFLHLRRQTSDIYYFKTSNGKEVDFIWCDENGSKHLLQVAENLDSDMTKDREVSALTEAWSETSAASATIVTRRQSMEIDTEPGVVHVLPAWKFLLS